MKKWIKSICVPQLVQNGIIAIENESGSPTFCYYALPTTHSQDVSEKCWYEYTLQYFFHTDCKYNLGINHQK